MSEKLNIKHEEMLTEVNGYLQSVKVRDTLNFKEACQFITEMIRRHKNYTLVDILEVKYSLDKPNKPNWIQAVRGSMVLPGIPYDGQYPERGIIGWCVRTKSDKLVGSIRSKPNVLRNVLTNAPNDCIPYRLYYDYKPETNTELALPIIVKNKVLAVLNVESEDDLDSMRKEYKFLCAVRDCVQSKLVKVGRLSDETSIPPGFLTAHRFKNLKSHIDLFLSKHEFEKNVLIIAKFPDKKGKSTKLSKKRDLPDKIITAIKDALTANGLNAFIADDEDYPKNLWENICVYMVGCKYAVVVLDYLKDIKDRKDIKGLRVRKYLKDSKGLNGVGGFNPNVCFEYGFMDALGRDVLVLKENGVRMETFSDKRNEIYKPFDRGDLSTIRRYIDNWVAKITT